MPIYNKLVRDSIPAIIKKSGKTCTTKILSEQEYIIELKQKLKEEIQEYLNATSEQDAVMELADILELLYTLSQSHHTSIEQLESIRQQKKEERGGFRERVFLIEVDE